VGKIVLLMLSGVDPRFSNALCQNLKNTFNHHVEIINKVHSLKYAYDTVRKQYESPLLLSYLRRIRKNRGDKILAIVDVDLYSPGYDFVYGEADINAGVATLSINRLISKEQNIPSNFNLYLERIIREATHEIGHLYGLGHCPDQKCVMRTCTCLPEVDAAGGGLCVTCAEKLKTTL
jgi:archaemetzincin